MSAALCIPIAVSDPTKEGLAKKFLSIQTSQGAALKVVSIYYDQDKKEHVMWYYPKGNNPSMVF